MTNETYFTVPGHYTQDFEGKRDETFAAAKARAIATIRPFDGIPGESRAFVDERVVHGGTDEVRTRWEVFSDGSQKETGVNHGREEADQKAFDNFRESHEH